MIRTVYFLLTLSIVCNTITSGQQAACKVCQRIALFDAIRQSAAKEYWPAFASGRSEVPLIYFSDTETYVAFSKEMPFKVSYQQLVCEDQRILFKMDQRMDSTEFHMENQMTLHTPSSPLYLRPMMFCSDVETMVQKIPDFTTTEEWLQLVMHEYFHSFQFSNPETMHYFATKIHVQEDSLSLIYRKEIWFSNSLKEENSLLLSAIHTTQRDSVSWYIRAFLKKRMARRTQFKQLYHYDIAAAENFWEKMEGTARYMERYTAVAFSKYSGQQSAGCDPLFKGFVQYKNKTDPKHDTAFVIQTRLMPKYYYVTGFNMCRLLDKLQVNYKSPVIQTTFKQPGRYSIGANGNKNPLMYRAGIAAVAVSPRLHRCPGCSNGHPG